MSSDSKPIRVAMAQIEICDGDLPENMRRAEASIREAVKRGAEFVCLPEAADLGWLNQNSRRDALPIPGKYTDFLSRLAKELNIWISAGCLEKDGDKTYNSAVIIDRSGEIVLKHRKIVTLPDITAHLYDPGSKADIMTVDTEFGRIGLTICADNFEIDIPQKAAELGAWLLIAPHGFAAVEGDYENNAANFKNHICSVAKETGMWVIGTDTVLGPISGGAWKGWIHTGRSTIANPEGEPMAVGEFLRTDLVICDIPRA